MPKMIFVNLPVRDLAASTAFYEALGGTVNPQFSDDTATSIMLSDTIFVMLLTHEKYKSFTPVRSATRAPRPRRSTRSTSTAATMSASRSTG